MKAHSIAYNFGMWIITIATLTAWAMPKVESKSRYFVMFGLGCLGLALLLWVFRV